MRYKTIKELEDTPEVHIEGQDGDAYACLGRFSLTGIDFGNLVKGEEMNYMPLEFMMPTRNVPVYTGEAVQVYGIHNLEEKTISMRDIRLNAIEALLSVGALEDEEKDLLMYLVTKAEKEAGRGK